MTIHHDCRLIRIRLKVEVKMRTCTQCEDLGQLGAIKSRHDLQYVVELIQSKLNSGFLKEDPFWPQGQQRVKSESFSSIGVDGSWPDYLQYYFRCIACDQLYALEVETYHGTGGALHSLTLTL